MCTISLIIAPIDPSNRTMLYARTLLLACLVPLLECVVDDLLQLYRSSLLPCSSIGVLTRLTTCCCDRLLIVCTVNRRDGCTNCLKQCLGCSPETRRLGRFLVRCKYFRQAHQASSDPFPFLLARLTQKCFALLVK